MRNFIIGLLIIQVYRSSLCPSFELHENIGYGYVVILVFSKGPTRPVVWHDEHIVPNKIWHKFCSQPRSKQRKD